MVTVDDDILPKASDIKMQLAEAELNKTAEQKNGFDQHAKAAIRPVREAEGRTCSHGD
jgi:hypothetical protein